MNLHSIATNALNAVSMTQTVQVKRGTVTPEGIRGYSAPETMSARVQPVKSEDLLHVANYNESSVYRKFYVNGKLDGLNSVNGTAGDLILFGQKVYLVVSVPEDWSETSGWSCVIGQLQTDTEAQW